MCTRLGHPDHLADGGGVGDRVERLGGAHRRARAAPRSRPPRPGSRRTASPGTGRAAPRAAGRCRPSRPGSAWRPPGTAAAPGAGTPSTVTVRSSITSSSADWVFGDARLISSAMTMLANTGPGWNSKPRVAWLKIVTPDTSEGSRSGVNWMRRHCPCTVAAIARARVVLPTPGTSSSSTCPWAKSAVSASRTTCGLPSTTASTFSASRAARAAKPCTSGWVSGSWVFTVGGAPRLVRSAGGQVVDVVAAVQVEPGPRDVVLARCS